MDKKNLALLLCCFMLSGCSTNSSSFSLPQGTPVEELVITESNRTSHSIYFDETLIAPFASVPDVISLTQPVGPFPVGTLLVYFNDTSQDERNGRMSFGMIYSVDNGATWSDRITVPITLSDQGLIAADASIVQLDDGSLRLYFYALDPRGDIGRNRDFYAASSSDGLSFALETKVFHTSLQVNNPDVVKHAGSWYLFLTNPEEHTAGFAVSDDPLEFSTFQEFPMDGIVGAASNGEHLLLYGCAGASVTEWNLQNDAPVFSRTTEFTGCDPSPYFDTTGALHMVTKKVTLPR